MIIIRILYKFVTLHNMIIIIIKLTLHQYIYTIYINKIDLIYILISIKKKFFVFFFVFF